MKSLFNFFGIPLKYSKNIIVNKKEILFEKKILKLELIEELKSERLENANILFFRVYKNLEKGKIIAYFLDGKERFPAVIQKNKKIIFNFDPEENINYLLNEEYVRRTRPIYTYLPFHYHKIPFRFSLVKILNFFKIKSKINFPDWPVERAVETIRLLFLASLKEVVKIRTKPFWPQNKRYAIALTHDIDTEKGMKNINKFSSLEKKYSFTSTWFLVGNYYFLDKVLLGKIKKQGNEIACHGYRHDNKLVYLPREQILFRLEKSLRNLKDFDVRGFRSPSLITSKQLDEELSRFFLYDSSITDTEKFPVDAVVKGCCSVFPFMKNNLVKIPITLPMDATLIFLRYNPNQILKTWINKLEYIKKLGGVGVINTHPEPAFSANREMLQIYEEFLDYISKDKTAWITNMEDIANWWKKR